MQNLLQELINRVLNIPLLVRPSHKRGNRNRRDTERHRENKRNGRASG